MWINTNYYSPSADGQAYSKSQYINRWLLFPAYPARSASWRTGEKGDMSQNITHIGTVGRRQSGYVANPRRQCSPGYDCHRLRRTSRSEISAGLRLQTVFPSHRRRIAAGTSECRHQSDNQNNGRRQAHSARASHQAKSLSSVTRGLGARETPNAE